MIVATHSETARIRAGVQKMIIQTGEERRWAVDGKPHPVQRGAFGPIAFYVTITGEAYISLKQLTEEDAKLWGASCLAALKAELRRRFDGWDPDRMVWTLRIGPPEEYKQRNFLDGL